MNHNQDVETPWDFIYSVEKYLSITFKYDMAATDANKKAPQFFGTASDSLSLDWPKDGWLWLNPPFAGLTAWTKKCAEQHDRGCKIVSVWPLSGDLNQIPTWVQAKVLVVHGRIWPEVRGCMLAVWRQNHVEFPKVSGVRWDKKVKYISRVW